MSSKLRKIAKALTTSETPFDNLNVPLFGARTRSGVSVTQDRALRHAAVWACVRNRAEDIAKLPVRVMEYEGKVRTKVDSPAWLQRPNPETTTFELIERTSASVDTDGNAFWYYDRDRLGRVAEVWVLPPGDVKVWRDVAKPGGPRPPKMFTFGNKDYTAANIVHIPGFSLGGRMRGMSPIEYEMHAIGLSIAAEEFGDSFFGSGAVMSGVVELPIEAGTPTRATLDSIRDGIERDHSGLRNAHRPGVLSAGAKWVPLTIPNDQAQFLETRNYQLRDIARVFRMPPHKIGDLERATFSNIEHQSIEYVGDGILPTVGRIEAAAEAAGLLDVGQHLRFNVAGLLRGDTKSRYESYALGIQWGWFCPDDVRELEDLNPLPDGQGSTYLRPLNMVPAGPDSPDMTIDELALNLQKMYLAVGTVITAEEAREILNRGGAGLVGSLPVPVEAP